MNGDQECRLEDAEKAKVFSERNEAVRMWRVRRLTTAPSTLMTPA